MGCILSALYTCKHYSPSQAGTVDRKEPYLARPPTAPVRTVESVIDCTTGDVALGKVLHALTNQEASTMKGTGNALWLPLA